MHDLIALAAQITAFAGSVPQLDPRLQLGACAGPEIRWSTTRNAVIAECREPVWRIVVPLRLTSPTMLIRRGDAVTIETSGANFRVAVEGIADNDAAAGMRLHAKTASGAHLTGIVGTDGSVTLSGTSLLR